MVRWTLASIGAMFALVCGIMTTGYLSLLASGGDQRLSSGAYVALAVFFGCGTLAGAHLTWRMLRSPKAAHSTRALRPPPAASAPRDADRERQVLRLAEHEKGRVTLPEVVVGCDLTIAEARATLDRLVLLEVAEIRVTETGVLVYVFPGFLSDADKARASDFS
jgi:hypothetical protein